MSKVAIKQRAPIRRRLTGGWPQPPGQPAVCHIRPFAAGVGYLRSAAGLGYLRSAAGLGYLRSAAGLPPLIRTTFR